MSSDRTAQRIARILAMVPWVIANPGARVDEVCRRFGYDRADLVRDLNLVFVCGLPGYGPGDLMSVFLDDDEVFIDMADYFARPVALTPAETLTLLAGGLALVSAGLAEPALVRAVDKLSAAVLPDRGVIDVDLGPEPELVGLLREAAGAGQVVDLEYVGIASGVTTTRSIEPWRVFAALGNWYVSGFCRRASGERVFRIDRIRRATVSPERFVPPEDPPAPAVRYSAGPDDTVAHIRLAPSAAWVAEYYPVTVLRSDAAGTTVEFRAGDPAVTARLLLRLADQADLLPEADGAEVASVTEDLRRRITARYR